jgi:hypothetical protein
MYLEALIRFNVAKMLQQECQAVGGVGQNA